MILGGALGRCVVRIPDVAPIAGERQADARQAAMCRYGEPHDTTPSASGSPAARHASIAVRLDVSTPARAARAIIACDGGRRRKGFRARSA